ncbi:FxsA family protein [Cohnella sp. REN36]|uniref:FxsA family protein n=1 Tax=Cohnella sp. REN36 TaxID=2887347 RepID=UPI001D14D564|nr:FxsA family protein [Cohnella sp. REN36]MCC3375902.1 FxsA family protein [Cohnella sp. REN36]
MLRKFGILIVIGALIEVWGIYMMSRWIGGWPTFVLLLAGALLGGWFARAEGRKVWAEAQRQLAQGQMPGHSLLDGICVLVGGLLLVVPGFLSDIVGITMLLPATRPMYRLAMYGWLANKVRSGSFRIYGGPRR